MKSGFFHEFGSHISASYWMCIYNSHNMSVSVCIKGKKHRKKNNLKLKVILQNYFVNMTFGKTFPVGSEFRYLVTSEPGGWTKRFWHMLTRGTKYSQEEQHALPFNEIPLHIRDLSSCWGVQQTKREKLVMTTNLQFGQEIPWITQYNFYMIFLHFCSHI